MAKKKVSHAHQEKPLQKQEDSVKAHQEITPSMDSEASEKLESLKSLNQMLLKEAFERRQQVDSLVQSKGSLESELTRSNSERVALVSELTRLGETVARLELERSVVAVFVSVQVGLRGEEFERKIKGLQMEMRELKSVIHGKESEIGSLNVKLGEIEDALRSEKKVSRRVCVERDDFEDKLNRQIEESRGLRENLTDREERKRVMEREIEELRVVYDAVVREKEDMEMKIQSLMAEKDSVERGLLESNRLIEQMKDEVQGIVREKEGIEGEKNVEMVKRQELENAVSGLNEVVFSFQKEEVKLRGIVAELEKKCVEGEERQKEMGNEIDQLVEEKKLSQKRIQGLVEERNAMERDFGEALNQLAEEKYKIEEIVNEKIVILEAKGRLDSEVVALRNQVAELKAVVLKLEGSNRADLEKIKSLETEVGEYRCKLDHVNVERDQMEHCLDEEKQNAARLKEKIGELENKIEESHKVTGEVKAENAAIFAEKAELESKCEVLKKEIMSLQNTITKARDDFDHMKSKVEFANANSELVLNMLKGTAAFCSKDKSDGEVGDLIRDGEEMKSYVMELEMIRSAFKRKVAEVKEMKKQLEYLHNSVEDAHKKKSFWTVLSSATTLLAAVSLAYVARGH